MAWYHPLLVRQDRENKQPRWVQDELNRLREAVRQLEGEVQQASGQGPENTDTVVVDPLADAGPLRLTPGVTVRFYLSEPDTTTGQRTYVDVRATGARIIVHGSGWPLVVEPRVSNVVRIGVR